MSWDSFIDPIAEFLGQDAESQVQQGKYRETLDGKYKPGAWDQFWGRANDGQNALKTQKNREVREKYKPILEAYDLKWKDGLTAGAAEKLIKEAQAQEELKNTVERAKTLYYLPGEVDERATRERTYNDAQLAAAQARNDALLAAAQNRADLLRSQDRTLQFQILQSQRENDRYYDRLEREDRKDLREGYKQLGLGLAALTAAFTIV